MFCGSLGGMGAWGRMDSCLCMAESLPCSAETVPALFVNRLYPNTKSLKKERKKCRLSGPNPDPWNQSLHFSKNLGDLYTQ